jgi:hypothetical protein
VTCFYKGVETPGEALKLVVSPKDLAVILWENDERVRLCELLEVDHTILERAEEQLSYFFAGTRRSFDIEPRPRRQCIPEERLESTANDSLPPDTLIREDRKCRWRSEAGPRRRQTARSRIEVHHARGSVTHSAASTMRGGYQKQMQQAPSRPPVTPFRPERNYMRGPGPKWVATRGVVADKRAPREGPIC